MKNKMINAIEALVVNVIDNKTTKVLISDEVYNKKYLKYYKRSRKMMVDNNNLKIDVNNIVTVVPTKPLSKNKSWKITEVIKIGASQPSIEPDAEEIK